MEVVNMNERICRTLFAHRFLLSNTFLQEVVTSSIPPTHGMCNELAPPKELPLLQEERDILFFFLPYSDLMPPFGRGRMLVTCSYQFVTRKQKMAPQHPIPFGDMQETVVRRGIRVTARVETVLQASMPTGYSAAGKYHVMTFYQSAIEQDAELSEEQHQRGRALSTSLRSRLEQQMRRAGWSEALTLAGDRILLARSGSTLWEYYGPPPRLSADQQLVSRRVKKRAVTFTCSICGKTVTQQRFPSHLPKYCSEVCKASQPNREAMREQTRLRVAAWRKAHPDARRKPKETDA